MHKQERSRPAPGIIGQSLLQKYSRGAGSTTTVDLTDYMDVRRPSDFKNIFSDYYFFLI